jgi:hypothetical protein
MGPRLWALCVVTFDVLVVSVPTHFVLRQVFGTSRQDVLTLTAKKK